MSPAANKLLDQAMSLSEDERLALATDLIASVDGPAESGWDDTWAEELERRATAAAQRGTPAPEWREVRARILSRLAAK
jgi:putative addiction module component (TIGR02574 family)